MQCIITAHRNAVLCASVFCLFPAFGTAQDGIPEPQPLHWGPPSINEALSGNRAENLRAADRPDDRNVQTAEEPSPPGERSVLRHDRSANERPSSNRSEQTRDRSEQSRDHYRSARRQGVSRRQPSRRRPPTWSPDRSGVRRPPWQGTLLPNPDRGTGNPPFMVVDRSGTKRRYIRQSPNVDLKQQLYQTAIVHDDTGLVLSASQLDFPRAQQREWEDDGYVEARRGQDGRDDRRRGRAAVEQASYEDNDGYDDYRYEFEDSYDDAYDDPYGEDRSVYAAQHFEELPPGVQPGLPIIESGQGGNYMLDNEGPALSGSSGNCCPSRRRNGSLLDLGFGRGRLFSGFGRSFGGQSADCCDGGDCCGECASGQCGEMCGTECGGCTELPAFWASADYLFWWTSGMYLPPLVTTSPEGTNLALAGRLGFPNTQILYGAQEVLTDFRDGGRLRGGYRVGPRFGIQAEYFGLEAKTNRYRASGTEGTPIITRPFFDIMRPADIGDNVIPAEGRQRVSFPEWDFDESPAISGTVTVDTVNDLESFGILGRYGLCCEEIDCGDCQPGGVSRIDILAGYRYMQLDDGLRIREDLNTTSDTPLPVTFLVRDTFRTHNDFHGAEVGAVWGWEQERWSLDLLAKLAVGSTRQLVLINGSTVIGGDVTNPGTYTGGLLAQTSNIGTHKRHVFSMIPELGATIGYRVTQRLRLTAGYTLVYWSRVVRPGDHVDLDVNRNLIPDGGPAVVTPGPLRPAFTWNDTDFWAQGGSLGVDYRW